MENDVMHCSRNGAKVVVKILKPAYISDMVSKLLTGQGLINGWEELFLLDLLYSVIDELSDNVKSTLSTFLSFLTKYANSLLELRTSRVCVYFDLKPHLYSIRSEAQVLGSYSDSSE